MLYGTFDTDLRVIHSEVFLAWISKASSNSNQSQTAKPMGWVSLGNADAEYVVKW